MVNRLNLIFYIIFCSLLMTLVINLFFEQDEKLLDNKAVVSFENRKFAGYLMCYDNFSYGDENSTRGGTITAWYPNWIGAWKEADEGKNSAKVWHAASLCFDCVE